MDWQKLIEDHRTKLGLSPDTVTFIEPSSKKLAEETGNIASLRFHTVAKDSRQAEFIANMEQKGFEWTRYSGRFMFGREAVGVSCGGRTEISEGDIYRATKIDLKRDDQGLGSILYV